MIYDLAIIGAGSGGLSVAAAAAQFGQKVILFEKGKMGGDCLNYGCVPSKALIAAAKHAHVFRTSGPHGIAAAEPKVDFKKVRDHIRKVIAAIEPHDSAARFEKLGVKVVLGAAKFRDAKTLESGGSIFPAKRIVIATGSRPAVPAIPGLETVAFFTNETIFENSVLPKHLIIIGGGAIGMELAQAHRRLGSAVTVIEAFTPLAKDDPELAAVVLESLRRDGVKIFADTAIKKISKAKSGIAIETAGHGKITGSHLLVATGRAANVEGLNLEAAGVVYTAKGVTVDKGLRTSQKHIYAIGDVAGGLQFTHVANYHAGLVIRNALFRLPVSNRSDIIPHVTFSEPELAQVGFTEAQALKDYGPSIKVVRWPFLDNDRAQAEGKTTGLIKAVIGKRGRILGVGIVGANAGEVIQPWVLAMNEGLKIRAIAGMVAPYPTLGEINRRVAVNYFSGLASNPWLRRVIRLVS
ncbi:MAG: FAD-dependent oxidoreductase [Hyphomicrobiales bacterium]|nr:FAD-dependent oxidoreductase [Hyphomicrobiales bacterium]